MVKVLLEDVATERRENIKTDKNGLPIVGLEHIIPQQIHLTEWDENVENTFTKAFYKGDILFGRRRAYLKKASLAPFDGICSGDITVITPKKDKIAPDLLPFIIQNDAFFDYAVEKSAGSLSPRVKWEHLKNYEFELPSLEEQRKLAKILWAAEETKQAYKNLLQKTDDLVKAKFEEMFGKISTTKKLTEISTPKQWKTIPTKKLLDKGYPVYGANGIIGYYTKYNHEKPTLLIGCRGTCGFINVSEAFSYINGNAMCLDKLDTSYDLTFIKYFLKNYDFSKIITGSTIPQITIEGLQSVLVPVVGMIRQNEFVEFAQQAEQSKQRLQKSLDSLNASMRALINENLK